MKITKQTDLKKTTIFFLTIFTDFVHFELFSLYLLGQETTLVFNMNIVDNDDNMIMILS